MEYSNENKGVLFKNDNKETEKHPDYKGRIDVNGQEYWLSAWIKDRKGGGKYLSLSRGDQIHHQSQDTVVSDIPDEVDFKDIPF